MFHNYVEVPESNTCRSSLHPSCEQFLKGGPAICGIKTCRSVGVLEDMEVSMKGGTPKWMVYKGKRH